MHAELKIVHQSSAENELGIQALHAGWAVVSEVTGRGLRRLEWGDVQGLRYLMLARSGEADSRICWACWFLDPAHNLRRAEVFTEEAAGARSVLVAALRSQGEVQARGIMRFELEIAQPGTVRFLLEQEGPAGVRVAADLALPPYVAYGEPAS